MSIFQKLGLVKDDDNISTITETKTEVKQASYQTVSFDTSINPLVDNKSSKIDYVQHMEDVIVKAKQQGFNFFEFNNMLNSMNNKPISEQQKYELAFTAAQSMGITAEQLINSAQYYLDKINNEESDFGNEVADAYKEKVTLRQKEVDKLTKENDDLAKRIAENSKTIQTLNETILNESNSLEVEKRSFNYALLNKRNELTDKITKIKSYLYATVTTK